MKKALLVFKKIIPICFLFILSVANSQQKNSSDAQVGGLKETLSVSHQTELKNYQRILDTSTTTIDSAKAYNNIATIHLISQYYLAIPKYDSIHYYGKKAMQLTEQDKTLEGIKQYLASIDLQGTAYRDLGYTSKALDNYTKILSITQNISNPSYFYNNRQSATTNIANFYASQENFELAIDQYNSLFKYIDEKKIDPIKISSIVLLRYARFHRNIGLLAIAEEYALKAKEVATRNDYYYRVAMSYLELGSIKFENQEINKANIYLAKAFKLLRGTEFISLLSEYYYVKSMIADKNSKFSEKIYNAEKAFELLNKKTVSKKHITIGNLLYDAYKENGNFQKANAILEQTVALEKILSNNEELKKRALLDIQQRDKNIQFEQAKSQTKSDVILFVLLLLMMAVITTIYIFKDRQKKMKLATIIAEKNKELKQLDEVKSQFFSNISHELQTPLTLIAGPIEQVLNESEKPLDIITKVKLQMVMRNTDALKILINDILDLSKLKAKKLTLNAQNTNLDTFFNTTTQKFIPLTKQKDISLEYYFKDLENFHATVDAKKLEKIINNLLSNAIKYTPQNGAISVTAKLKKSKQLQLIVKDTGVGISEADAPKIFNRYFQTSDITKPLEGGSGIGLSLVKELVELMNGKVTVESKLGEGSTFIVTLPVKKATSNLPESYFNIEFLNTDISLEHLVLETELKTKVHTILIVEDHIGMQEFITSILQKRYKLLIVNNGKEALEKLKTNTVDLIVSDVMMPVMDGFTLLEMIKQSETYDDIPMIMLTALSEINYKLKALTIGADDYLTKPFIAKELLARTHNLLERYVTRKKIKAETTAQEDALEELLTKTDDETNVLTSIDHRKHTKIDIELIAKVAKLIEQNIDNPDFKLNDLSEELFLGERQLRRKIKLITGLSTKKFQQEIQLLKARTLLEEDAYGNVTAVAISVGMDNVTRFSKLYVERFGKHPADYFKA